MEIPSLRRASSDIVVEKDAQQQSLLIISRPMPQMEREPFMPIPWARGNGVKSPKRRFRHQSAPEAMLSIINMLSLSE